MKDEHLWQDEVICIGPADAPADLPQYTQNCVFYCGGTTFGRFIFTKWGTLAQVNQEDSFVQSCVFQGNHANEDGIQVRARNFKMIDCLVKDNRGHGVNWIA
jgi:hypothetical protein